MAASSSVLVIGAGALGLSAAVTLTRRGHAVTVIDPGAPNASSIAAGMIAPAMESATEDGGLDRAALLRAAAALWPVFAANHGIDLIPAQTEWRGPDAAVLAERLIALGFGGRLYGDRLAVEGEFRLSSAGALARLTAALDRPPLQTRALSVASDGDGWSVETEAGRLSASALVIATGTAPSLPGLPQTAAACIADITPIRGQIGWTAQPLSDRTLRGAGIYVTPVDGGAVIGATMEAGRRDLATDADTARLLLDRAWRLLDQPPRPLDIDWRVGVRGATADGLPLAGPVGATGLHLALAPRRNGWLLGPLVGQVVADAVEGRAPAAQAAALDPLRFSPQAG